MAAKASPSMKVIYGRGNPRSDEDRLTAAFAAEFRALWFRRSLLEAIAPKRLNLTVPEMVEVFGRLGPTKPDLLFSSGDSPKLYVEAKLGCQI